MLGDWSANRQRKERGELPVGSSPSRKEIRFVDDLAVLLVRVAFFGRTVAVKFHVELAIAEVGVVFEP